MLRPKVTVKRKRPTFARTKKRTPADIRKDWESQVKALYKCLDKLNSSKAVHGTAWVEGMVRHYERKLDTLYDQEPPEP